MNRVFVIFLFGLSPVVSGAEPMPREEIQGTVVRVTDGDSFTLRVGKTLMNMRLWGVDAPERAQPGGLKSLTVLKEFLGTKEITVEKVGVDVDRRILVIVQIDGTNLNEEILKEGWGWCAEGEQREPNFAKLEAEAKKAKRGIWAEESAEAPWAYRARKKDQTTTAPAKTAKTKIKTKVAKPKKEPKGVDQEMDPDIEMNSEFDNPNLFFNAGGLNNYDFNNIE